MNIEKAKLIDGWMNDIDLWWLAQHAKDATKILELGSYAGRSTRALCDNTSGYVTSVDKWTGIIDGVDLDKVYNEYVFNLFDHHTSGTLRSFRQTTDTALDWFINHDLKFDFIFIDASHEYEQVRKDIIGSLAVLEDGGIISGHDYEGTWTGVKKAVDEVLPNVKIANGIWYWRKD